MARAMLLALAFAELASGARYVDYGGAKMPQYGGGADYDGPRDEYDDHTPDILSASHDYRDEDELIGKTMQIKEIDETEVWQKFGSTGKYRRQSSTVDDGDIDTLDKYSPEEMVPKFRPTNRFVKHRSLKIRDFESEDMMRRRPSKTRGRHGIEDLVRKDDFDEMHSDDFRKNKHSDLHEDPMEFTRSATTARINRRKPRDRFDKPAPDDDDPLADLGLSLGDRGIVKSRLDDYRSDTEFRRNGEPVRRPPADSMSDKEIHRSSGLQRRPPGESDLFPDREESMDKPVRKPGPEYSDYYDMKRVQSIKHKLPSILHVTTEAITVTTTSSQVVPFRRSGGGIMMAPVPHEIVRNMNHPPMTTTTVEPSTTTTTKPTKEAKKKIVTIVTSKTPVIIRYKDAEAKLSFAQKSKLSILKSLKKESGVNQTTTKPPILLHVTQKSHTIVMVEPPTAPNPMLRGIRLVSNDSPGMLAKVKRMMRLKLLSNSKSLRDLTEDWDSMVCDYIDTSLLTEDKPPFPDYLSNSNINLCTPSIFILFCLLHCFKGINV